MARVSCATTRCWGYRHNLSAIQALLQNACFAVIFGLARLFAEECVRVFFGSEDELNSIIQIQNLSAGISKPEWRDGIDWKICRAGAANGVVVSVHDWFPSILGNLKDWSGERNQDGCDHQLGQRKALCGTRYVLIGWLLVCDRCLAASALSVRNSVNCCGWARSRSVVLAKRAAAIMPACIRHRLESLLLGLLRTRTWSLTFWMRINMWSSPLLSPLFVSRGRRQGE